MAQTRVKAFTTLALNYSRPTEVKSGTVAILTISVQLYEIFISKQKQWEKFPYANVTNEFVTASKK